MINLLCLLCSMCIQFCAFSIPYEMSYDDFTLQLMNTFSVQAESSEDPRILFFADMWKTGEVQYFLFNGNNGNYEIWFDASKYNSSYTSSVVGRIEDNTNTYLQIELKFNRYYKIVFNPNYTSTLSCSFPNDYGWDDYLYVRVYPYTQDSYKYLYMLNGVVNNSGGSPIIYGNYVFNEPVDPVPGNDNLNVLGSLSSGGHSSGGSPLEDISSTSFSPINGTLSTSGHSVSIGSGVANYDFSNATQNLLGQIVNNSNSLIGHSSAMYDALHSINDNVVSGVTSLFNAVSVMNDNFISSVTVNEEVIDEFWEESNAKQTFDAIGSFQDTLGDKVDDYVDYFEEGAQQKENELTIDIDLRNWSFSSDDYGDITPMNRVYTMRFPFLDETKALWQPFLLGLLYFALVTNIYFDFPNILRGAVR